MRPLKHMLFSTFILFALVVAQFASPTSALAAGTVGTGTAGSCTEAALDAALSGGGAVSFNCGAAPHTIVVTTTKVISSNTQIDGLGLITLSGGGTVQIFTVQSGFTLSLANITLANGNAGSVQGGAISIATGGTVNITNSTFSNNTSAFDSVNATATGGAGAIYNAGTLTITGSTFAGNTATGPGGDGGAIVSKGAITVTNSTFYNNSAITDGTGGTGGAIRLDGGAGPNTITHVTLSNNANDATFGALDIVNTDATVSLSILANSVTGTDCTKRGASGTLTSTNNLIESGTCTSASTADPGLGTLQNNSGNTQTMAITAASPAYNFTSSCPLATDQRGVARPQPVAGNCDLGAYELDNTVPTVGMSSAAPNLTNVSPIQVTVQFSEAVTGFNASDITAGNGTVGNFVAVDADTYTFNLTPSGQGLVTADIAAGVAVDLAGNGNTAATQFSRTFDNIAPTVAIGAPSTTSTNTGPVSFSITISGANTINVTPGNVTLNTTGTSTGTVSISGGTTASPIVTISSITGNGTIGISIAAGVASDAAGNPSAAAGPSATFTTVSTVPGAATLTSPNGILGMNNPTYTWNAVSGATWYYLWVDGPNGTVHKKWYSAGEANCTGTCSLSGVTPNLPSGNYTWWVQTYNDAGYGPWSDGLTFTAYPVGKATLSSPSGTLALGANNPTYTWNAVSGATYYYLWVDGPNGTVHKKWYSAGEANCTGTCSVTNATPNLSGAHTWWVQTWNEGGYGPWSDGLSFTAYPVGQATLSSPSGTQTLGANNPTYTWNAVSGATWYYLWVIGPTGDVHKKWYSAGEAGCTVSTCSLSGVTPNLAFGDYSWSVQTWNEGGYGPWSDSMSFSLLAPPAPGKASLSSPAGITGTNNPTYTWNAVSGATWYYLWVDGPNGNVHKKWYSAGEAGCTASTCSVTNATPNLSGAHTWWVRTWNEGGYGPWSDALSFTAYPVGQATLSSPSGTQTLGANNPTYTWNAVSGATWYYLWVDGPNGTVHKKWYSAVQANCTSTCSLSGVTPSLPAGDYSWWIQTWNDNGYGPWSDGMNFNIP